MMDCNNYETNVSYYFLKTKITSFVKLHVYLAFYTRPVATIFRVVGEGEGVRAYLKNRDRTINVGMIGRVSSEDRRVMGTFDI